MVLSSAKARIGMAVANPFKKDGRALVGRVTKFNSSKEAILRSVNLIGGFDKVIQPGDEVLLKPNFNTADPPPGSSDPEFVKAIIELLYERGAKKVVLGESSMFRLSTRNVLKETGMLKEAEEVGAEVAIFDEGTWRKVATGGMYLRNVSLPEIALESKKVVYTCCMKTHRSAKFTFSLKLAVGFMKPSERIRLHMRRLEEKVSDLNLVVKPHLIIMDGRKCFISGGPATGELRNPGLVLASGDRVALDVEALKTVAAFEGSSLRNDPWSYTQVRRAVELGLGARNRQEYEVVDS